MHILGLTGGISTGKSTVSKFLSEHGIAIIDADLIAREIVRPGQVAYHVIIDTFGQSILDPDGTINRQRLGAVVFSNPDQRRRLNAITHPYIRIEMIKSVILTFLFGASICVLDTPLLFEAGLHRWVHSVVVVYCPDRIQKERLILRDDLSPLQAQMRIDSQMPIDRKRSMADAVIDNSGSISQTRRHVDELLKRIVPSVWVTRVVWLMLCVPAAVTYGALVLLQTVDRWRRLGVLSMQRNAMKGVPIS